MGAVFSVCRPKAGLPAGMPGAVPPAAQHARCLAGHLVTSCCHRLARHGLVLQDLAVEEQCLFSKHFPVAAAALLLSGSGCFAGAAAATACIVWSLEQRAGFEGTICALSRASACAAAARPWQDPEELCLALAPVDPCSRVCQHLLLCETTVAYKAVPSGRHA